MSFGCFFFLCHFHQLRSLKCLTHEIFFLERLPNSCYAYSSKNVGKSSNCRHSTGKASFWSIRTVFSPKVHLDTAARTTFDESWLFFSFLKNPTFQLYAQNWHLLALECTFKGAQKYFFAQLNMNKDKWAFLEHHSHSGRVSKLIYNKIHCRIRSR